MRVSAQAIVGLTWQNTGEAGKRVNAPRPLTHLSGTSGRGL